MWCRRCSGSGRSTGFRSPSTERARWCCWCSTGSVGRRATRHAALLPELSALDGRAITTVVPSTTPAALTSITTGLPPGRHGITGFRMRVDGRCSTPSGGSRRTGGGLPIRATSNATRRSPTARWPWSPSRSSAPAGSPARTCAAPTSTGGPPLRCSSSTCASLVARRRAVRVRVLPGGRRGRARVRHRGQVLRERARGRRPARRRGARRAAGGRRARW